MKDTARIIIPDSIKESLISRFTGHAEELKTNGFMGGYGYPRVNDHKRVLYVSADVSEDDPLLGWHYPDNNLKLRYGDGRRIRIGETLSIDGNPHLAKFGLHADVDPISATHFIDSRSSRVITRVALFGNVHFSTMGLAAATHRKVIAAYATGPAFVSYLVERAGDVADMCGCLLQQIVADELEYLLDGGKYRYTRGVVRASNDARKTAFRILQEAMANPHKDVELIKSRQVCMFAVSAVDAAIQAAYDMALDCTDREEASRSMIRGTFAARAELSSAISGDEELFTLYLARGGNKMLWTEKFISESDVLASHILLQKPLSDEEMEDIVMRR